MDDKTARRLDRMLKLGLAALEDSGASSHRPNSGEEFIGLRPEQWPSFCVRWDLRLKSQRFVWLNVDEVSFFEDHPTGLILLETDLKKLDEKLTHMFKLHPHEFWAERHISSNSRIIAEWVDGKQLTPPFVRLHDDKYQLVLEGNHRLAVAGAKGETRIPILVLPDEAQRIKMLLEAVELKLEPDL